MIGRKYRNVSDTNLDGMILEIVKIDDSEDNNDYSPEVGWYVARVANGDEFEYDELWSPPHSCSNRLDEGDLGYYVNFGRGFDCESVWNLTNRSLWERVEEDYSWELN